MPKQPFIFGPFVRGVIYGALVIVAVVFGAAFVQPRHIEPRYTTYGWTMPPTDTGVIVNFRTPEWIAAEGRRRHLTDGGSVTLAFSGWSQVAGERICQVYVPPLNDAYDMEFLRHEVRHCLEGQWHP